MSRFVYVLITAYNLFATDIFCDFIFKIFMNYIFTFFKIVLEARRCIQWNLTESHSARVIKNILNIL